MGRKKIVDVPPAKRGKRIRTMADPEPLDFARAAVMNAYAARESLSIVERIVDAPHDDAAMIISANTGDRCAELLEDGAALLRAVLALLHLTPEGWGEKTHEAIAHVNRAIHSTHASIGHLKTFESYVTGTSERERKQQDHYHGVLRRSTRASRQEAHRALAEILEVFPTAYTEQVDDGA